MQRSTDRILTTHVGSLPRPPDLQQMLQTKDRGEPYGEGAFEARVAQRIVNYARIVGRENVIAAPDCGFGTFSAWAPRVHPEIMWAKFRSMVDGASIASERLWGSRIGERQRERTKA